jgi:uncharacterized protein (TIGR03435 family)
MNPRFVWLLLPVGVLLLSQPQSQNLASSSSLNFEVASVKPSSATNLAMHLDAARVDIRRWSLQQLILRAYNLWPYQLSGPDWMATERFDVLAKLPQGAGPDQLPNMLQSLLVERFHLAAHEETRTLQVLALVVAKNGPKMQPAPSDAAGHLLSVGQVLDGLWSSETGPAATFGPTAFDFTNGVLHVQFTHLPMIALAQIAGSYLHEPVIDGTGLTASYQVTLNLAVSAEDADALGSSVFSAVERLGLRLERRRAPVSVLVVDRLERVPTEN